MSLNFFSKFGRLSNKLLFIFWHRALLSIATYEYFFSELISHGISKLYLTNARKRYDSILKLYLLACKTILKYKLNSLIFYFCYLLENENA